MEVVDTFGSALEDPVLRVPVMGSAASAVIPWFASCLSTHTSSLPAEDRCYF